jgi:hypothetical protein
LVAREGFRVQSLSNVEYCAAHLVRLMFWYTWCVHVSN